MKILYFVFLTSIVMLVASCNSSQSRTEKETIPGIEIANLDTTAVPGNDFYQYACGGWMASHPLKPEHARFGTFDQLREDNQEQVKGLIQELSKKENPANSIPQKIGTLYALAMDSVSLNKQKATSLKPYLEKVTMIKDKSELSAKLAEMYKEGFSAFFSSYVYADDKNSSMNIFHLNQGGYNMGDRDYYLEQDVRSKEIRTKYIEMIEKLFVLAGYQEKQAKEASSAIMNIETKLATIAYPREKLRDPEANYHKITLAELQKKSPLIDWQTYFSTLGLTVEDLNVGQPEPIATVSEIIKISSLDEIKYYLAWNIINNAASYLSDDFVNTSFEFYGKTLSGTPEQKPRWKRAVNAVNNSLGEAIGQLYVEKYFPPTSKEKMLKLVKNLQIALGERINALEWMSDETKAKAQEKLAAFHVKIGYPEKWRDYSKLEINNDSYLANIVRSNAFEIDYMLSKFNQSVDKDEWLMTPQTVNAYYNPATNEICFPAAILQPPFFNPDADDAVNYGAIGVVIGHEMTHGFDDQGRQYDKEGNLKSWWTEEDVKKFKERADVLVKFFDNIIVLDTVHANGQFTLGENIADQGGLQVSWQAFQNVQKENSVTKDIDGFTPSQRFFLSYGTIWAGNIRNEEILHLTKMDSHSLGRWRVNGALPQISAWYDTFNVKPDNKMYIPQEKRVAIW